MTKKYQALIVLGRNWRGYPGKPKTKEGGIYLSLESKMSSLAALKMYERGLAEIIILSSGKTAGNKWPTEAAMMADFIRKRNSEIPENALILEENSLDTYSNIENTRELISKYGLKGSLALLTVSLHLPRSIRISNFYGLDVDAYSSEAYLKTISEHYKTFVERYEKSCFVRKEKLREVLLRYLQLIDPEGKIPRAIAKHTRN